MPKALFIGRFQPLHNAHLKVIKDILKENDEIVIGIGSSQEKNTEENPFSAKERRKMITAVLKGNKIKNYEIVEIPDYFDDKRWCEHIKENIKNVDIVYSGNSYAINCLRKNGFKVKRIKLINGVNSSKIREIIRANGNWERLLPREIFEFIKKSNGVGRIKGIKSKKL